MMNKLKNRNMLCSPHTHCNENTSGHYDNLLRTIEGGKANEEEGYRDEHVATI